jgi:taurine dioxygenase
MRYQSISVAPMTGALGAEITGVDLRNPSETELQDVYRAFLDHLVLFFRDQDIAPGELVNFARSFGEIDIHPYSVPLDGHPEVLEITKEKDDSSNFGGEWHTDMTYNEQPPKGVVIVGREIPPRGGDTLFANMYAAYEALSDTMKGLLEDLYGLHSAGPTYSSSGTKSRDKQSTKVVISDDSYTWTEHPLVRTHPETGRKCLFLNPGHTYYIKGMRDDESKALLEFLFRHCVKPEFCTRFSWTQNTVALWDNRCTQHVALNDYHGYRRVIHRTVIKGDRPFNERHASFPVASVGR